MCTLIAHWCTLPTPTPDNTPVSLPVQSAAPSAPPAMSFLPCLTSPAKHLSQSEKKHELKQRIEEKDRKVKEFELQKHKEHKDKFKYVLSVVH